MAEAKKDGIQAEIGIRIARMRTQRGWSQERLGLLSDVKPASISAIEQGYQLPTIPTIMRICKALQCSYVEVLPPGPGMKTSITPEALALDRALENLTEEQRNQILNVALAAAGFYAVQKKE